MASVDCSAILTEYELLTKRENSQLFSPAEVICNVFRSRVSLGTGLTVAAILKVTARR